MEPLRIALCITDLDVGGAERCLVELATRLDRKRFEPMVYCLAPLPTTTDASCASMLQAAGIPVVSLEARQCWSLRRVVRQLADLLLVQEPGVLQSFLFHANMVGWMAGRRAGVPWVLSGIRVAERRGLGVWRLWADWLTSGLVDRYVCVSESVAEFSRTRGRLPPEKLVVISNGIDIAKYPARHLGNLREFGILPDRRVVTYVGRLDRQKGLKWLLRTAQVWLPKLGNVELLLVGDGPQRNELERLAERSGIGRCVHFAGWRADVPEILAASSLLVLPSAWEGMPNVVLEAMASRLPVVATDVEGVRELLGPEGQAQVVTYGDNNALTAAIIRILSTPELAQTLAAENRRRAEERFSVSAMVAAYGALWESLARG